MPTLVYCCQDSILRVMFFISEAGPDIMGSNAVCRWVPICLHHQPRSVMVASGRCYILRELPLLVLPIGGVAVDILCSGLVRFFYLLDQLYGLGFDDVKELVALVHDHARHEVIQQGIIRVSLIAQISG